MTHSSLKPRHGGNALFMCETYEVAYDSCIDLTAAINPMAYEVGNLPELIWQRLPQEEDGLLQAAMSYYGVEHKADCISKLMMTPGSSWTINNLPNYFSVDQRVWIPEQGYKEHEYSWTKNGFSVRLYADLPEAGDFERGDIFVLINPNNPTAKLYEPKSVIALLSILESQEGYLIIDEAFMDITPELSLTGNQHQSLIVLRSFGKFFGLAGIRLGAVWASSSVIDFLQSKIEPWAINSPARYIANKAFQDERWAKTARREISELNTLMFKVLSNFLEQKQKIRQTVGHESLARSSLFITLTSQFSEQYHEGLARKGIFTRLLDDKSGIRFGLATRDQIPRIGRALNEIAVIA